MAEYNELKPHTDYIDAAIITIPGPDNSTIVYQYDQQTRAFYARESTLPYAGKHGGTHIGTDPIPTATCTTNGLMSSDDKCRLDTLVGTKIGVLGFVGSGMVDDGGWLDGPVILAAGSEAISIERVGNVIRFVVDMPVFNSCVEDCLQMYWIQDDTDINAIRPPINGGRLAGVNSYGELKVYLFPENTVVDTSNPGATLSRKGYHPTLIFKRYDDGVEADQGEMDMVLARNEAGTATVGWAFTPGATGKPEWQVSMGVDDDGNLITFKLDGNQTAGALGSLLYNGNVITKKSAIITGYDSTVVDSNIYKARYWDMHGKTTVGDEFSVTNQVQFDVNTNQNILDAASDTLLNVGQVIDVWSFKVGESNGTPVYVHYCREKPSVNTSNLWVTMGAIQFGDTVKDELSNTVTDTKDIEDSVWGSTGITDQANIYVSATNLHVKENRQAIIDTSVPCLLVTPDSGSTGDQELPVLLWHRASLRDAYLEVHLARPDAASDSVTYPTVDVLLRAPIDSFGRKYMKVTATSSLSGAGAGTFAGTNAITVKGVDYSQLPSSGIVRTLFNSSAYTYGVQYRYTQKFMDFTDPTQTVLALEAAAGSEPTPTIGEILELIPSEFMTPALRLQFGFDGDHDISMQPIVGTLDMAKVYDASETDVNDLAGDFVPGYAVGNQHWQDGVAATGDADVTVSPEGFIVYTGAGSAADEAFNVLRIKIEENRVWAWWNTLLLAPNAALCASLPTPVDISTPYYTISDVIQYGKFGLRLWPGAKLRRFIVRSKPVKFSETSFGQILFNS